MTEPHRRTERQVASETITDGEVDAAIAEAGGDTREAVRNLLHDIAVLAADQARQVSHGYLRGRVYLGIDSLKLP